MNSNQHEKYHPQLIDLTNSQQISATIIRQVVAKNRPTVLRYLAGKAMPNYLSLVKHEFPNETVAMLRRPLGLTNAAAHGKFSTTTLDEYFEKFSCRDENAQHDWIVLSPLDTSHDNTLSRTLLHQSYWDLFPNKHNLRLWITPKNRFTGAHFDSVETFNLQLYGVKKFILYPPGIWRYKVNSPFSGFGHTSKFNDFETVNIQHYPKWQRVVASRMEITIHPGEILYIPPGWWHQAYNEQSLAMNGLLNFSAGKKLLAKPYILFDLMLKTLRNMV